MTFTALGCLQVDVLIYLFLSPVIDAMGKPRSGILQGYFIWLGNYDECIGAQALTYDDIQTKQGAHHAYDTKYCLASFKLSQAAQTVSNPSQFV